MRRQRPHLLIAALAVLVAGPGAAQLQPSDVGMEAAVQKHLGLFLTTPDRRESHERVVREGPRLEAWFLRPVDRARREAILCEGFRWLLTGRLVAAGGVRALFAAHAELDEVTLVFYDLETRVEPDREGRYRQLRNAAPHARYTVSRSKAELLRPEALDAALKGPGCVGAGRPMVDLFWAK